MEIAWNELIIGAGTIGSLLIVLYTIYIKRIKQNIFALIQGIKIFKNRHVSKKSVIYNDYMSLVIKPADNTLESIADLAQKLKLKKVETKLRDLI